MLPNDEVELDREDMKHHEWLLITESRLHLSPIPTNPQRILDICTGTGIWAMQIAEVYPSATVIGTDISPVQPRWVPPNLTFEIDDIEEEWLYKSNAYDLVNCRFNFIAIKDWPAMLRQAMRVLKPGGYVELTELEIRPIATNKEAGEPTQLHRWLEYLSMGMQRQGFDFYVADKFKGMLEEAGFEAVVEKKFEVPWGAWCTDKRQRAIGFWHLGKFHASLHPCSRADKTYRTAQTSSTRHRPWTSRSWTRLADRQDRSIPRRPSQGVGRPEFPHHGSRLCRLWS